MRPIILKSIVAAVALSACSVAVAQRTIVVDPKDNPAVRQGGVAQQLPLPPGVAAPTIAMLQADLKAKTGADMVQFGTQSHEIDDTARQVLTRQAQWLRMNPMVRASLEGHADGRQTRDAALALGERRAAAVRGFLLAQGIPPQQLVVRSWGKERPAVEGAHEATWLQNSRVAIVLQAMEAPAILPPAPPIFQ